MADPPFGFGLPNDPGQGSGGSGGQGGTPGGGEPMGPFDPQQIAEALRQFADLMSYRGGPVNWDLAKNTARTAVAQVGDPSMLGSDRTKVADAIRLADLWLDEVTSFPSGIRATQAWSRSEWVEATFPVWARLCDPVADKAVSAMGAVLSEDSGGLPPELSQALQAVGGGLGAFGGLSAMLRRIGGMLVGSQAGNAVGMLAQEVVSSTDVGLPLGPEGTAALLPSGVAAFGEGLSVGIDEVRLFLALREAAHHRLFAHVPWLRGHLFGAVEEYARGITVDDSQLRDAMQQFDLAKPETMQQAMEGAALFRPEDSPQQKAALARLETALALVEGWVSTVVDAAAADRLPEAAALAEAIRRRRATGGPAERTFATLVGLELRPRRLREAAAIWRELTDARGTEGRDALWSHPDLLPTAEDFDDPARFVRGRPELDMSELEQEQEGRAPHEGRGGEAGDQPGGDQPGGNQPGGNQPGGNQPGS